MKNYINKFCWIFGLSALLIGCGGDGEVEAEGSNNPLDTGVVLENAFWAVGGVGGLPTLPESELGGTHVYYAVNNIGARLFYNEDGMQVAADVVQRSVPFQLGNFNFIEHSRNGYFTLHPALNNPSGVVGDKLFYRDDYSQSLTESQLVAEIGGTSFSDVSIVTWTDRYVLFSLEDIDSVSQYQLLYEADGSLGFPRSVFLGDDAFIQCVTRNGEGNIVVSEITEDFFRTEMRESLLDPYRFGVHIGSTLQTSAEHSALTDVTCVDDAIEGPKVIFTRWDTRVYYMDTGTLIDHLYAEGIFQFPWGANVELPSGSEAIQFHSGSIFEISTDPDVDVLYMNYDSGNDEVCWIRNSSENFSLELECENLSFMRDYSTPISR